MAARKKSANARILAPTQERSAATVRAIETAIDEIIAKDGVNGITSKAVAERAGVSSGTLYQYFRTREALVASWELRKLQREMDDLMNIVTRAVVEQPPLRDVIFELTFRGSCTLIRYIARTGKQPEFLSTLGERVEQADTAVQGLAAALSTASHRHRDLPQDVTLPVWVAFHAVVLTCESFARTTPSDEALEAIATQLAHLLVRFLVDPDAPKMRSPSQT